MQRDSPHFFGGTYRESNYVRTEKVKLRPHQNTEKEKESLQHSQISAGLSLLVFSSDACITNGESQIQAFFSRE